MTTTTPLHQPGSAAQSRWERANAILEDITARAEEAEEQTISRDAWEDGARMLEALAASCTQGAAELRRIAQEPAAR